MYHHLTRRVSCFQKVNKIEINYSKTAKKMDMKRLKTSMWGLLTESPDKPPQVSGAAGGGGAGGAGGPGVTQLLSCRRRCPRTRWRSVGTKSSVKPPRRCCAGTDHHRGRQ